jgi:hypothetical protein
MNPFYIHAIWLGTLGSLVVAAHDQGKTSRPPANVISKRPRRQPSRRPS